MPALQHHCLRFLNRRLDRHSDYASARRHHIADLHPIQVHDVSDDLEFFFVDRAFAPPDFRQNLELSSADGRHLLPFRTHESIDQGQRHRDRFHHDDQKMEKIGNGFRQLLPISSSDGLRNDL